MNNETLADIAREMRTYFQTQKRNGNPEHRPWHQVLSDWADRIEAAAEREMAKGMSKKLDGNRSIPGNAAAMREALREMRTRLVAGIHDGSLDCYKALEIVESALAEPPRNCDRFQTASEVSAYWNSNVRTVPLPHDAYGMRIDGETYPTFLDWLMAPAKEGK